MIDLNKIKRLNLPRGQYCIFGSGPLEIAGLRKSKNVNLMVKRELWDHLSKDHNIINDKLISIDNINIYKDWLPWVDNIDSIISNSEIIDGVSFAQLEDVKSWKLKMARPKDLDDVKLIDNFLNFDKDK